MAKLREGGMKSDCRASAGKVGENFEKEVVASNVRWLCGWYGLCPIVPAAVVTAWLKGYARWQVMSLICVSQCVYVWIGDWTNIPRKDGWG